MVLAVLKTMLKAYHCLQHQCIAELVKCAYQDNYGKIDSHHICDISFCKTHLGYTVKPALSGHSKIDKLKIFKTNSSLMKVKGIAECCTTFDLH